MAESHMQECDAEKCLRKMVATKTNRTSLAVAIVLMSEAVRKFFIPCIVLLVEL